MLDIVLKPKLQTDNHLIQISKFVRARYCQSDEVIVTIFDNKKHARKFSVYDVKQIPDTARAMYYLNRKSGNEKLVRIGVTDNKHVETPIELK